MSEEKMLLVLQLLLEGNSIRSTMRITGVDGNTIMKALALAGEHCEKVMARRIVKVPVKDVQCDEIWSFVFKKQKAVEEGDDPNWAALCLWFGYYNFCRIHRSLRVTPAMEAGITDHVWELAELLR